MSLEKRKVKLVWDLVEKIKLRTVSSEHNYNNRRLESKRSNFDLDRNLRLEKKECKFCYYFVTTEQRSSGSIMQKNCGLCRSWLVYPVMSNNELCLHCAQKFELCSVCFCDVEFRPVVSTERKPRD